MSTLITPALTAPSKVTVSDYLDCEWAAEQAGGRKAEYVSGEVRQIPGASWRHNAIVGSLFVAVGIRLRGKSFAACGGEMRVRVAADGPYYYPDLCISPVPPAIDRDRGESLLNPISVIEVLSPTTETVDRREKLASYARVEGLSDYLIVEQDLVRVDQYTLQPDGSWRLVILAEIGSSVILPSVGIEIPLAEVYDRVFPAAPGA